MLGLAFDLYRLKLSPRHQDQPRMSQSQTRSRQIMKLAGHGQRRSEVNIRNNESSTVHHLADALPTSPVGGEGPGPALNAAMVLFQPLSVLFAQFQVNVCGEFVV